LSSLQHHSYQTLQRSTREKEELDPIEEALKVASESMECVAEGDSIFCTFGHMEIFNATTFRDSDHLKCLLQLYRLVE